MSASPEHSEEITQESPRHNISDFRQKEKNARAASKMREILYRVCSSPQKLQIHICTILTDGQQAPFSEAEFEKYARLSPDGRGYYFDWDCKAKDDQEKKNAVYTRSNS